MDKDEIEQIKKMQIVTEITHAKVMSGEFRIEMDEDGNEWLVKVKDDK